MKKIAHVVAALIGTTTLLPAAAMAMTTPPSVPGKGGNSGGSSGGSPTSIPEPGTVMLLGAGLAGLAAVRRRRKR